LTKVLPLTSNGLVESPESVIAGAAIPPRAEGSATGLIAVREAAEVGEGRIEEQDVVDGDEGWIAASGVEDGASTKTVLVTREQVELVLMFATPVGAGASTVTKPVVTEHRLSVSDGLDGLVATTRSWAEVVLAARVVVIVAAERTEPVTVAVGGTVAVAVIVPGVAAVGEAVDATLEQASC
jgi:hypothetical protein